MASSSEAQQGRKTHSTARSLALIRMWNPTKSILRSSFKLPKQQPAPPSPFDEWLDTENGKLYSGIPSIGQETLMVIYKSNLEEVFKDLSLDFKASEDRTQLLQKHKDYGIAEKKFESIMEYLSANVKALNLPKYLAIIINRKLREKKASWEEIVPLLVTPFLLYLQGFITIEAAEDIAKSIYDKTGEEQSMYDKTLAYIHHYLNSLDDTYDYCYNVAIEVAKRSNMSPTLVMEQILKMKDSSSPNDPLEGDSSSREALLGFKDIRMFLRSLHDQENNCVRSVSKLIKDTTLQAPLDASQIQLFNDSIDQISSSAIKHCVRNATRNNFTIIDGGAGTRKSEILKNLVHVLSAVFPNYQIDVEVPNEEHAINKTGITPRLFHRTQRAGTDVLIIYSSSLISLESWDKFFCTQKFNSLKKLIVIGDSGQLGAGRSHVFWNFLKNHAKENVVRLDNYDIPETPSGIVSNARKVISALELPETTENKDFEIKFIGRDREKYTSEIKQFVAQFGSVENFKETVLLSATANYKNKLNQICQSLLNESKETYWDSNKQKKWKKGDRIIWGNDTEEPLVMAGTKGYIVDFLSISGDTRTGLDSYFSIKREKKPQAPSDLPNSIPIDENAVAAEVERMGSGGGIELARAGDGGGEKANRTSSTSVSAQETVPIVTGKHSNARGVAVNVQENSGGEDDATNRKVARKYFVTIKFEDRADNECVICDSFLENAELGYALTVEEARGSSASQVLCVLNNDKYSTSQLLYTAMMVAKEKFLLLIPSQEDLESIVNRRIDVDDSIRTMLPEKYRQLIKRNLPNETGS